VVPTSGAQETRRAKPTGAATHAPELAAEEDQLAVVAVADEDGRVARPDEDAAVFALVDGHGGVIVEHVQVAVLAVLNDELLSVYRPATRPPPHTPSPPFSLSQPPPPPPPPPLPPPLLEPGAHFHLGCTMKRSAR